MEQDTRIKLGRLQMEDCGQGGNVPELSAIKVPAVGEVAGDGGGRGISPPPPRARASRGPHALPYPPSGRRDGSLRGAH